MQSLSRTTGIAGASGRVAVSKPCSLIAKSGSASIKLYRSNPSLSSLTSSFSGLSLSPASRSCGNNRHPRCNRLVVESNAKNSMGAEKGMGTNRKRRRTSGFKTRMRTTAGRKILKNRRMKGRKVLCPASSPKGKYTTVKRSKM